MKDDSISTPPDQDDESKEGSMIYAPLKALQTDDGTSPEVGDEVEFTVKGTVSTVSGDVACVTPTQINDERAPSAPDPGMSERDSLRNQAVQADEAQNYP